MGERSAIEWTEATWNPIVGCSVVSPGCTNCYAMKMAARIERMAAGAGKWTHYNGTTQASKAGPVWTGRLTLAPDEILTAPLRWKRPRRVFVNSMSDLFHEAVPDEWIDRVFAVMALAPQHTFQVLTKRSERMRAYMTLARERIIGRTREGHRNVRVTTPGVYYSSTRIGGDWAWPLPNVWLGVSTEDQRRADERVPDLLATPAAVRFVSAEPLLGPIRFDRIEEYVDTFEDCGGHPDPHWPLDTHDATWLDALRGCMNAEARAPDGTRRGAVDVGLRHLGGKIDWIIVGGESGAGARPMHPDWARSIRDQCAAAGVPFFFKQWGEWLDEQVATAMHLAPDAAMFDRFGAPKGPKWHPYEASDRNGGALIRVGKARAGRLLDGREHNDMPEARPL